jgi:hypothetical protein
VNGKIRLRPAASLTQAANVTAEPNFQRHGPDVGIWDIGSIPSNHAPSWLGSHDFKLVAKAAQNLSRNKVCKWLNLRGHDIANALPENRCF